MADQTTLLADRMKRLHGHFDNTHMYTHCHGGLASPISLVVLLKSFSELEAEQNADPSGDHTGTVRKLSKCEVHTLDSGKEIQTSNRNFLS